MFAPFILSVFLHTTVGQVNQEYRLNYRATRSSVQSFACTAHSFARSLTLLTPSLMGKWMMRWLFILGFFPFWTIVHSEKIGRRERNGQKTHKRARTQKDGRGNRRRDRQKYRLTDRDTWNDFQSLQQLRPNEG